MPNDQISSIETCSAAVILENAIDKPLDYLIPSELSKSCTVGRQVLVPLRNQLCRGVIWELKNRPSFSGAKPIHSLIDAPALPADLIQLAFWIHRYYGGALSQILRTILPTSLRENHEARKQTFIKSLLSSEKLADVCRTLRLKSPKQAHILDLLLQEPKGLFLSNILEKGGSKSAVSSLLKKKLLFSESLVAISADSAHEYFPTKAKELNGEQKEAFDAIAASLKANTFNTHLLFGITGSGKTEIYLQAIELALSQNKQIIFLVPEISLTSQTLERLRARFSTKLGLFHHRLSKSERSQFWRQVHSGEIAIVVGARSAIFSPTPRLGLVIVDEEHDGAYKQSDQMPAYHGRDVAILRAKLCNATAILGSATPSFESLQNCHTGKFILHRLKMRAQNALLPKIRLIDMKREFEKAKSFTLFSDELLRAIEKRLSLGEQTLLFLNRRGYRRGCFCAICGFASVCPQCDISLTYHLNDELLCCHLCDFHTSPLISCPSCQSSEGLKFKAVGTEMVERRLHGLLPTVRTLRLDSDTSRHKGSGEKIYKEFKTGKADVLIGTQMIAKGLHFPAVTLVGILQADASLHIPDFRASEHLAQLLLQVSGRSGRASLAGEVLVQTSSPEHPLFSYIEKQDYEAFFTEELQARKLFSYPPFAHLIKFLFSGPDQKEVEKVGLEFRKKLIASLPNQFEILPLVASTHAKINNAYRFQFIVKGHLPTPVLKQALEIKKGWPFQKQRIRFFIDVDPTLTN